MLKINSDEFLIFSKNYGNSFYCDEYVYRKYLEPSMSISKRNWEPAKGYKNSLGFSFDFELGFVENKNLPNAICGHNGIKHIIVMYHTVPIVLLEFFNRLLCDENLLKNIGNLEAVNKNATTKFASPPGFAILMGEVKINHLDDIIEVFAPKCDIRKNIGFQLYNYAMTLIWEHELAHAINGHVHYAQNLLGAKSLQESVLNRYKTVENDKILSYIEMLADKGACFNMVTGYLYKKYRTPFEIISNDEKTILDFSLRILSGSFLSLLWMIADIVDSTGDINSINYWTDHPSSIARAINFTLTPMVQSETLPEEIKFIIEKSTELSFIELLKLSDTWGIFKPFKWLAKKDMFSNVFPSEVTFKESEIQVMQEQFNNYRYNKAI